MGGDDAARATYSAVDFASRASLPYLAVSYRSSEKGDRRVRMWGGLSTRPSQSQPQRRRFRRSEGLAWRDLRGNLGSGRIPRAIFAAVTAENQTEDALGGQSKRWFDVTAAAAALAILLPLFGLIALAIKLSD